MPILKTLERIFLQRHQETQVALKEIYRKRRGGEPIRRFKTPAVGTGHTNPDGSKRQRALEKLKAGDRVRLIWHADSGGEKDIVYLLRGGGATQQLALENCFGRLSDKVAADVVRWLTRDNVTTVARVERVTGGTRKQPRLGCVLELSAYNEPDEK